MKNQKKPLFHYAWVIMICGCCIVGINLGVIAYTIGNFYLPMSLELGVGVGDVAFYQTMQAFASALTFPTARKLMHKYGIRKVLTCATISAVLGFCALSQVQALWQVYLAAAVVGAAIAFYGGVTVPLMINNWFKKNNGTIYGACLAMGAITGVFANPLISAIIGGNTWREGYLAIAAITAVVMLPVSIFLVRMRPEDMGMKPYGADDAAAEVKKDEPAAPVVKTGVPAEKAFKSVAFILTLICVPCFGVVFNATNHITTYASVIGIGAGVGATLTSVSLIGGTLGKLSFGRLSDVKGVRFAVTLAESCAILGLGMVIASTWVGSWLLFPAVFVFGYGASTTSLMGALIPRAVFGDRDYDKIMSYTSTAMSIGSGLLCPVYGYLYDFTGSYLPSFAYAVGMALICVTCANIAIIKGGRMMKEYN